MKVTADRKKRVALPSAKPGDVFEVRLSGPGQVLLLKLEPISERPANVRIVRRGGHYVGVTDRLISESAIKELLAEFP